jgi:hypothetical protein
MALPKIDTPVYDIELPLSQKTIRFRPFLVKEQKNLLMAIEADDKDTIEKNVKQILHNCTLTEDIDIESLPVVDVEFYFLQLRAKSVGEIVENKYICNNEVDGKVCNNQMDVRIDLTEIKVDKDPEIKDTIQITEDISIKLKYPQFSTIEKISNKNNSVDMAFDIVADSIEYIFDGKQYYYAYETSPQELSEFIEGLSTEQFNMIEEFFTKLPRIRKTIEIKCSKCGFDHSIELEGLQNFFG